MTDILRRRKSNNSFVLNLVCVGYTIPKGWKFFAVVWNIHMNPDVYVQPKEFNPSRWDVSNIHFN